MKGLGSSESETIIIIIKKEKKPLKLGFRDVKFEGKDREDPLAEPMRKLTEDSLQFCLGLELFPIICKLLHEPCSSLFAFTVFIFINSQHFLSPSQKAQVNG